MIVGKAPVLQKPGLLGLGWPAARQRQSEAADAQLACPLAPVNAGRERRLDQGRSDPKLRQLALDAQRPLTALGVQRHILLRVALIVDEAALNERIDDALHRGGLKALVDQRFGELARAEVAS